MGRAMDVRYVYVPCGIFISGYHMRRLFEVKIAFLMVRLETSHALTLCDVFSATGVANLRVR